VNDETTRFIVEAAKRDIEHLSRYATQTNAEKRYMLAYIQAIRRTEPKYTCKITSYVIFTNLSISGTIAHIEAYNGEVAHIHIYNPEFNTDNHLLIIPFEKIIRIEVL
jgi:hypothetical protein